MSFDKAEQMIKEKTIHDPKVKRLYQEIDKEESEASRQLLRIKLYIRQVKLLKQEKGE